MELPLSIDDQVLLMKKYVVFIKKGRIKKLLQDCGYFRLSRYGKYLLSFTSILRTKPNQELLFGIYKFDVELRKLFFTYTKKAEIQFKSLLSNAISLKLNDSNYYLDDQYYTKTRGERDRQKRSFYIRNYPKFKNAIVETEKNLRTNVNKYPEFTKYRRGGSRYTKNIPCWAAFSYFEFGTITNIYAYLRGDLRKEVLIYGYSRARYGKEITKEMDTWLDAIRNLRNVCAHHNKLVGKTSSIVLLDSEDDPTVLPSSTDLFSRIYALKKVLSDSDGMSLQNDLKKLVAVSKVDIFILNILPSNWEQLYGRIKRL